MPRPELDQAITTPAGQIPIYVARPASTSPVPGVVVIHDAMGMSNEICAQADWLAANGYLAVAPDLFHGRNKIACMVGIMRQTRDRQGPAFAAIEACRAWLAEQPGCTGRSGVIGFCFGGGLALLLAPDRGFSAASVNYGTVRGSAYSAGLLETACPIVGSYGGADRSLPGAAAKLEKVLTAVGVDHDIKEYPGVGHAFLNDRVSAGDQDPALFAVFGRVMKARYDPPAAADARARILVFFARHLRSGDSPL